MALKNNRNIMNKYLESLLMDYEIFVMYEYQAYEILDKDCMFILCPSTG